jgi:hypothetical protein
MSKPTEPPNAFSQEYLEAVHEQDEPSTSLEADTSGPFSLEEQQGMIALFRAWESYANGDVPQAVFRHRETALLFQAIWPALGRNRLFRLKSAPSSRGYEIEEDGGQIAGCLQSFNTEAVLGGHFASCLARVPLSLSLLVEASGPVSQRHLGRILARRVLGSDEPT